MGTNVIPRYSPRSFQKGERRTTYPTAPHAHIFASTLKSGVRARVYDAELCETTQPSGDEQITTPEKSCQAPSLGSKCTSLDPTRLLLLWRPLHPETEEIKEEKGSLTADGVASKARPHTGYIVLQSWKWDARASANLSPRQK